MAILRETRAAYRVAFGKELFRQGVVQQWIAESRMAMYSSGRTHHELLLIEVGPDVTPIPPSPRVGMYHFGLKIGTTDDELRDAYQSLVNAGANVVGSADHGVTHSLYITDPDGNEIELYIDVQPEAWREDPEAIMAPTRALRL